MMLQRLRVVFEDETAALSTIEDQAALLEILQEFVKFYMKLQRKVQHLEETKQSQELKLAQLEHAAEKAEQRATTYLHEKAQLAQDLE